MPTVIKLKRGTSTPTTSDITNGEVAVDTSAKKIYINDSGTIKEIGVGDAASSPQQVLIKDANGTAIKARTGLAATGGSTFKTEKSDENCEETSPKTQPQKFDTTLEDQIYKELERYLIINCRKIYCTMDKWMD